MNLPNRLLATLGAAALLALAVPPARAENWPHWRGPLFNGSSPETGLPAELDKDRPAWVAPMPGHSSATPIVWGDRVFVSSTDADTKALLAIGLGAADGKVLWQRRLGTDARAPRNDMASPSPCTDGRRVFFLYGTGDLAALDPDGKVLWTRDLAKDFGNFAIKFGYSSSPLLYQDRLYVTVLRRPKPYSGPAGAEGPLDSFLLAIDPVTGEDRWRHVRPTDALDESYESYATAIPHERAGRAELLLLGGDYLTAHDPASGKETWRFGLNAGRLSNWRVIPSPVPWQDLVFAAEPRGNRLLAVRAARPGARPGAAPAWAFEERATDSATPLVYRDALYILQSDKADPVVRNSRRSPVIFLFRLDPKTGAERWRGELGPGGAWRASPTGADGKIYCLSEEGEVVVLAAADEFKVLSRTMLGDGPTQSSIAVAGGRLYVRTERRLYCFAAARAKTP